MGALEKSPAPGRAIDRAGQREHRTIDLAAMEDGPLADEAKTTITLGHWRYAGTGWATNAETTLATACAARAREHERERAAARHATNHPRREIHP